MYCKIHNYARYFQQAPKVDAICAAIRSGQSTVAQEVVNAPTHSLARGVGKTTFRAIGDEVTVAHYWKGSCTKVQHLPIAKGRELWSELTAKGWTKF